MLSIHSYEEGETHEIPQSRIRMAGVSFEVIDKYKDAVYRAALTVTGNFADAEDILQDVFLQYYQSHPAFTAPAQEKAWLLRCAINKSHNLMRSQWHLKRVDVDLTLLPEEAQENGGSEVLACVLRLPERYRTVIYLHYYENYTIAEIARILGCTDAAAAKRLSRGRVKLRAALERIGIHGTGGSRV